MLLHEAGPQAGGRCRSFFDDALGLRIDNGNHLLMSGNHATMAYLKAVGAQEPLVQAGGGGFPFLDLGTGRRWTVQPDMGPLPTWIFDNRRRVPGTHAREYLRAMRLALAGPEVTAAAVLDRGGELYRCLWKIFAASVLNTDPIEASAALLWPVVRETLLRGGRYCRPLIAREDLAASFVDPALAFLAAKGSRVRLGRRLRKINLSETRALSLEVADELHALGPDEQVVLALPAGVAAQLLPDLAVPTEFRPIVNVHYLLDRPLPGEQIGLVGLIGGTAEWVFTRGSLASVTVSAATDLVNEASETIAARIWPEVLRACNRPAAPLPAYRVVKEKRATFAQTPAQVALRPATRTRWRNVHLAGDWTATGLPATVEGAIRSGNLAAECVLRSSSVS